MSKHTDIQPQTEVAGQIARLILRDEEQNPMPWWPSPGMLVARVTERFAQASMSIILYHEAEGEEQRMKLLDLAVFFIGAATFAINAIPHVHPAGDEGDPIEIKAALMRELDEQVAEALTGEYYSDEDRCPDDWLQGSLALLTGACQSTCEWESAVTPLLGARAWEDDDEDYWQLDIGDEDEDDESDEDDSDEDSVDGRRVDELREAIANSLFSSAVVAATAGQWFTDAHEQWENAFAT